jgi:hypothetical protein
MRIRQYASLSLSSSVLSADEITRRLGVEPDEVMVMASKRETPPTPAAHHWMVKTNSGPVDEMTAELIARIRPVASDIRDLVSSSVVSAVIQVVRYFNDDAGDEEQFGEVKVDGQLLEKLLGQHQLLGFHLDAEVLGFLSETGIELDLDEYG